MVKPVEPRMYVVVRKDLDQTYRMVQGAHALAAYAMDYPDRAREWDNEYLIFLGTFLEASLEKLFLGLMQYSDEMEGVGFPIAVFKEPDQKDQLTAIAVFEDGRGHVSKLLRHLPLA
jgi:hypothetical protein